MPVFGLMLLIQGGLIIHVLKSGRDTKWIWLLMALPGVGALAYVMLELAPDILGTRQGRDASKRVMKTINPNKELNEASLEYERTATVANSTRLADECLTKGRYAEASELYGKCLTGINEFDPDIMFGLAKSDYGLEKFSDVKTTLDTLIEKNSDYKNQDAHLLYAMTLARLGETEKSLEEFDVLAGYYTGPEAKYRYGVLLKDQGQQSKAQEQFESIMKTVQLSPKHYKNMHKEWINLTRKEMAS